MPHLSLQTAVALGNTHVLMATGDLEAVVVACKEAPAGADDLAEAMRGGCGAGIQLHYCPTLKYEFVSKEGIDKALATAPGCVVVTSPRAAAFLATYLSASARPVDLPFPPVFAVGRKTAAPLVAQGVTVHGTDAGSAANLVAPVAAALDGDASRRRTALFLCGDKALPGLPDGLAARGVGVTSLVVYRSEAILHPPFVDRLPPLFVATDATRVAVHYAPSAVRATADVWARPNMATVQHVAIGPTTASAVRAAGIHLADDAVATSPTPSALVAAIVAAVRSTT